MRYRGSSKKIRLRQHSILPGLQEFLETIEPWEEVKTIIPGPINPKGGRGPLRLTIQPPARDGLRCVVKLNSGSQRVFLVSSDPEKLTHKLRAAFPDA